MTLIMECIGTSTSLGEDRVKYRIYDDMNLLESEDIYYTVNGPHNEDIE